jgi:undecaprenyl diphosphate synthase
MATIQSSFHAADRLRVRVGGRLRQNIFQYQDNLRRRACREAVNTFSSSKTRRMAIGVVRRFKNVSSKINMNVLVFLFLALRLRAKECCGATAFMFLNKGISIGRPLRRRNNEARMTVFDLPIRKTSNVYRWRLDDTDGTMQYMHSNGHQDDNAETSPIGQPTNKQLPARTSIMQASENTSIPNHIAFVCDGNARWARQRGFPIAAGHAAGADRLIKLIEDDLAVINDIDYATFYAFSTENWKRSDTEIRLLFSLMERTAQSMMIMLKQRESSKKRPIVVRFVGDTDDPRIPESLRMALHTLEDQSITLSSQSQQQQNLIRPLTVSIAVNYSARHDIVQAVQKIAAANVTSLQSITQEDIRNHLSTKHIPDPDLIVRTSGENRLSNYLLWEAAYAEFYVTNVHWPDFDQAALRQALQSFGQRQRRFGGREQAT